MTRFSAPASSANLGPAFDCLGLALELRNELELVAGSGQLTISGEGAATLPTDAGNLVARAFDSVAPGARERYDLLCTNRIPLARGLGSSTSAAALGLMAGWTVGDVDWDQDKLFDALRQLDGHADNAAACVYGGFVLAATTVDGTVEPLVLGAADWLAPLLVIPNHEVATADARAALPASYSREEVVAALGGMAMLMTGLIGGDPDLLADALHTDVLHEQQRGHLVPELADVRACLHSTKALGATLSGAGPSVLVWCRPEDREQALGSLSIDFPEPEVVALEIATVGARIED